MNTTFTGPRSLRRIDRILALIKIRAMTAAEIAQALHADKGGINFYLKHLRGVDGGEKRVYIESFDAELSGPRKPRYRAGNKPDAVPPPPKNQAQLWASLKASEPRYRRHQARKLGRKVAAKAKTSAAPWAMALGL